jgi:protein farnesyltransferase subunit beta
LERISLLIGIGSLLMVCIDRRAISSLKACQHPDGGFSGGQGQIAHLAPTYAAVNTLALFGGDDAFELIDRESLYTWLMSMKQTDGGFLMHHGGEVDARYLIP